MLPDNNTEAECSVSFTAMAKMVDLSRARLYQLIKKGVFPGPVYYEHTKRPFYTPQLQKKCLKIRKTGIGFNGNPVIFNTKKNHEINSGLRFDDFCGELVDTLKNIGIKVTKDKVKSALQTIRPDGLRQFVVDEELIRDVFGYFKRSCK